MAEVSIDIADNIQGSPLPGTTHPVAFESIGGKLYQYAVSGFVPKTYDSFALTYNGDGTVHTITYSLASTALCTVTLSYTNGVLTGGSRVDAS